MKVLSKSQDGIVVVNGFIVIAGVGRDCLDWVEAWPTLKIVKVVCSGQHTDFIWVVDIYGAVGSLEDSGWNNDNKNNANLNGRHRFTLWLAKQVFSFTDCSKSL